MAGARTAFSGRNPGAGFCPRDRGRPDFHVVPDRREPGCRSVAVPRRSENSHYMTKATIIILLALHAAVVFAGFLSPYHYAEQHRDFPYAPPTPVHFSP